MIPEILKTAGQVAGIGGLALGVLLVLFREVIRKNIFPNLSKEQAYKLLRMIIVLTFLVAIVGIVAWVVYETQNKNNFDKTTLLSEFVLDDTGQPSYLDDGEKKHYKMRLYVIDATPDVTSVVYDPHDSSYQGETFPGGPGPNFKTQPFSSWGDLDINVILSKRNSEAKSVRKLSAALDQNYAGNVDPKIRDAINQIKGN